MLKEELRPIVGDILVSIEDVTVLHLNSIEVQRYIKRLKLKWKKNLQKELSDIPSSESMSVSSSRSTIDRKIKVVFRRHYVNNVEDIIKHDQQFPQELQKSQSIDLKVFILFIDLFIHLFIYLFIYISIYYIINFYRQVLMEILKTLLLKK